MQRLLLDTHVFLWWLADSPDLASNAAEAIADARNEVFVSAATGWEIAIKRAAEKLSAPDNRLVRKKGNSRATRPAPSTRWPSTGWSAPPARGTDRVG